MGLKEWILPQDKVFFDLLERHIALADACATEFKALLGDWGNLQAHRQKIKELEHEADITSHQLFERLNSTFITPIDREDIARLAHAIDDVADSLNAAATRLMLFEVPQPTPPMGEFIDILQAQLKELTSAMRKLRRPAQMQKDLAPHNVEIHRLENLADKVLNRVVAELFKTNDAVHIMKYKEVYEYLEGATDRCEDVADVLSDVVRKHG
jgi:uncharacterized protein